MKKHQKRLTKLAIFIYLIGLLFCSNITIYASNNLSLTSLNGAKIHASNMELDTQKNIIKLYENIKLEYQDKTIYTNYLEYDQSKNLIIIKGDFKIETSKYGTMNGSDAILNDKATQGEINNFAIKFPNDASIKSESVKKIDSQHYSLKQTHFTPCRTEPYETPLWRIIAGETYINYDKNIILHKNVVFKLYKVPIFYLPYVSHPLDNKTPKSGILRPSIRNDALQIPLYLRIRENFDFTLTPRIAKKYRIFDLETRYKFVNGDSTINFSVGNPKDKPYKSNNSQISQNNIENTKTKSLDHRYYLSARGDFYSTNYQNMHYGFALNKVSDKAYLKNHFNDDSPYLTSKYYIHQIYNDKLDYYSLELLNFQDLRSHTSGDKIYSLPHIKTFNNYILSDNDIKLDVNTDILIFKKKHKEQINRFVGSVNLSKRFITDNGLVYDISLFNRADMYNIHNLEDKNHVKYDDNLYRHIPELRFKLQYPLLYSSEKNISQISPIISYNHGKNAKKSYKKFALIDASKYSTNAYNIFAPNKFHGIDYHDYGQRINIGITGKFITNNINYDFILGKIIQRHNLENTNSGYSGNINLNLKEQIFLNYDFRSDKNLYIIDDEIGAKFVSDNFECETKFARINNIAKYHSDEAIVINNKNIRQLRSRILYNVNNKFEIGYSNILDLSKKKHLIQQTIQMTYKHECASIKFKIHDNFSEDETRSIVKKRSKTFAIGLKILNM